MTATLDAGVTAATGTGISWQFTPLTAELVDQLVTLPAVLEDECAACRGRDLPLVPTVTPVICVDCLDRLASQVVQPA